MPYDRHRATNRWAIATALGVWLTFHVLVHIAGMTARTAGLLAMGGLLLLTLGFAWPWVRHYFRRTEVEVEVNPRSPEFWDRTLVSAEIVVLSAVSMLLLMLISP